MDVMKDDCIWLSSVHVPGITLEQHERGVAQNNNEGEHKDEKKWRLEGKWAGDGGERGCLR
jgi:hypothetical protein